MAETYLNLQDGRLYIGDAAIIEGMEQPGSEMVPFGSLLRDPEFEPQADEERPRIWNWSKEDYLAMGEWAVNLLAQELADGDPLGRRISYPVIAKLNKLGISPNADTIAENFGSMWRFGELLGVGNERLTKKYADWTLQDAVSYAAKVAKEEGRKPREANYTDRYRMGVGPHPAFLTRRWGLRTIHEHIGYVDVRNMDDQDFLDWGVKVLLANPGKRLTLEGVIIPLAKAGRGPWDQPIRKRFGSLTKFQQLVDEEFDVQQAEQAEKDSVMLAEYAALEERGDLMLPVEIDDEERLTVTAKYIVARACAPRLGREGAAEVALMALSDFMRKLQSSDPRLDLGYIESTASRLEVFDYIWPLDQWRQYLRIDPTILDKKKPEAA